MRRHYLDNIRITIILMLFFYHKFMIWNNYENKFYVWGGNNNILSTLIVLVSSWFMPILFVIALILYEIIRRIPIIKKKIGVKLIAAIFRYYDKEKRI